jgi:two-component system chemotaxis response regulator CheY
MQLRDGPPIARYRTNSLEFAMTLRVLLVDDQASIRLIVRAILGHIGYDVLECGAARDAFSALSLERFAFALVDLNLPDISGFELLQRCMAANLQLPPVFGITSLPIAPLMRKAQATGMCGVLKKPLTREQLVEAATSVLAAAEHSEHIAFTEWPIDPKMLSQIRGVGDEHLAQRFVDQAILDARRSVDELAAAAVLNDIHAWRAAAETLHGTVLTLGARRLACAAGDAATLSDDIVLERSADLSALLAQLLDEATVWLTEHVGLLTGREQACLRLAAAGQGTKGIADKLSISEATVKFHLNNAALKLNARGRVQAVAKAVRVGAI